MRAKTNHSIKKVSKILENRWDEFITLEGNYVDE